MNAAYMPVQTIWLVLGSGIDIHSQNAEPTVSKLNTWLAILDSAMAAPCDSALSPIRMPAMAACYPAEALGC